MFNDTFQGPGMATFTTHTLEILIMWLVSGLIGLLIGYILWYKYRQRNLKLMQENEKLKVRPIELEAIIAELRGSLAKVTTESANFQSELTQLNGVSSNVQDKYVHLLEELAHLKLKADELTIVNTAFEKKNKELAESYGNIKFELEALGAIHKKILEKVQELSVNFEAIKNDNTSLKDKNINLFTQLSDIQKKASFLKDEKKSLQLQITQLEPKIESLQKDNRRMNQQLNVLTINADDLTQLGGINEKEEALLHHLGISTYRDVANTPTNNLYAILLKAGQKYQPTLVENIRKEAYHFHQERKGLYQKAAGLKIGRKQLEFLGLSK